MPLPADPTLAARAAARGQPSFLGRGLLHPFRRDGKADFASDAGVDNLRARVAEVLGTKATSHAGPGELPWRSSFGSRLHLLRHQPNHPALGDLAAVMVQEALRRWEPRARVTRVERVAVPDQEVLELRVLFSPTDRSGRPLGGDLAISVAP